jgi:hypothetical protein
MESKIDNHSEISINELIESIIFFKPNRSSFVLSHDNLNKQTGISSGSSDSVCARVPLHQIKYK